MGKGGRRFKGKEPKEGRNRVSMNGIRKKGSSKG